MLCGSTKKNPDYCVSPIMSGLLLSLLSTTFCTFYYWQVRLAVYKLQLNHLLHSNHPLAESWADSSRAMRMFILLSVHFSVTSVVSIWDLSWAWFPVGLELSFFENELIDVRFGLAFHGSVWVGSKVLDSWRPTEVDDWGCREDECEIASIHIIQ